MKTVTFVLPQEKNNPIGGFKIIYSYANHLILRGWQVNIGYDCRRVGERVHIIKPIKKLMSQKISEYRCKNYPKWFLLSSKVRKFCIYSSEDIGHTDNLIATAVGTADLVNEHKGSKKFYFIQDYEVWDGKTKAEVEATYRLGMNNIVISRWLKNIVDDVCENDNSIFIPNGIDMQNFFVDNCPIKRQKKISMLFHQGVYKGSTYGIQVLEKLKKIYPDLDAVLFGVPKRPDYLPRWIEYVQNATSEQLHKIYNESQIYLYPAIEEGFGLTCVESMACGCALCSTDYRGVHEFAINEENALLSPVRNVDAMVHNACRLIDDQELRIKLAENAIERVKYFSWEKSVDSLVKLLSIRD